MVDATLIGGGIALLVVLVIIYLYVFRAPAAAQVSPASDAVALAPGAVASPAIVVNAPGAAPVVITACEYNFAQGVDSGGSDIKNVGALPLDDLKKICDTTAGCKGFNSNGWLKSALEPREKWYKWTDDANKGFYAKKDPGCTVKA